MNKRIKELKHLASVWCDENIPEQWSDEINGYGKGWEDKFAELLVRECVGLVNEQLQHNNPNDSLLALKIKEHFGVRE